jgi:hypothetical protein
MQISVLRKRFFATAVADVLRAIDGCSLVGAMALSVCIIDYLAYMRKVSDKNEENYKAFVQDFLTNVEPKYKPDWIYAFRCALVHTYGHANAFRKANLGGYLMHHMMPTFHLSGSDNFLRLNVESFVTDIVWLSWRFFESVSDNPKIVEESGDKILIVHFSDSKADIPYSVMHQALRELDRKRPNYNNLYMDIAAVVAKCPQSV